MNFLSITDQVAGHLRAEILRGRWSFTIPGKHQLAGELGINNKTVEAALRQLEKAGLLLAQGAGRRRRIQLPAGGTMSALRIAILLNEGEQELQTSYHVDLHHALSKAGHSVLYAANEPVAFTETFGFAGRARSGDIPVADPPIHAVAHSQNAALPAGSVGDWNVAAPWRPPVHPARRIRSACSVPQNNRQ